MNAVLIQVLAVLCDAWCKFRVTDEILGNTIVVYCNKQETVGGNAMQ